VALEVNLFSSFINAIDDHFQKSLTVIAEARDILRERYR
jgi:hypothetical protein